MKKSHQALYLFLIFSTLIDILLLCYMTFYPVSLTLKYAVITFDLILCIVLWIEFIYSYRHSDNKKQYLKDNAFSILGMLPIDIIFLRALRLIKLVQLIKLLVIARNREKPVIEFLRQTYLDRIIFISIVFVFIITVLISIADSNINDIRTAFWYIIVSMTSTGYGDIVPVTISGQIIGVIAMVGGILIFATITAVISSLYVSKINTTHTNDLESKIEYLTSEVEKLNDKIDELKKE